MGQLCRQYNRIINRTNISKSTKEKVIRILLWAIRCKDKNTADHCKRVMRLAVGYVQHYGFPYSKVNILKYASLLHDIGKIIIPKKILIKPYKLSTAEFDKIKKHSIAGFLILRMIPFLKNEATIIKQHHERIDGCGYPYGLSGDKIDELSKILSVCDAFDAMTNNRSYRDKLSMQDALNELSLNAGSQFDQKILESFSSYLCSKENIS